MFGLINTVGKFTRLRTFGQDFKGTAQREKGTKYAKKVLSYILLENLLRFFQFGKEVAVNIYNIQPVS